MDFNCPVCGHGSQVRAASKFYPIRRCENGECDHIFAETTRQGAGVTGGIGWSDDAYAAVRDWFRSRVDLYFDWGLINQNSHVLDFGCGPATFLRAFADFIPADQLAGIEAAPGAEDILKKFGMSYYKDLEETLILGRRFDFCVCIEVLEHVDTPVQILTALRRLIKPGGALWLSTPPGAFVGDDIDVDGFSAYVTPEHVQFFTQTSLTRALRTAGFEKVRFVFVPQMYEPEPVHTIKTRTCLAQGQEMAAAGRLQHLVVLAS